MKSIANKKLILLFLPLVLAAGIFFIGPSAMAGWAEDVVGGLFGTFISALGLILVLVLQGLTVIASYQHFIDARAVVLGWVIVRDISNMFFVVVLMIIAFGTILNLENYNYKKLLPKLILMAVLINFSKTICGLLIDVSQVVMLTFVNAFKDIGSANLTDILGITDILTLAKNGAGNVTGWEVAGAYVLGFIYLLVAIVVITTMMMILTMRLVMIWIYVVLSPAAYLLAAVPGGQKYSEQWWSEFIKSLIVGPVLAFFIWLSIAALQVDNQVAQYSANDQAAKTEFPVAGTKGSTPSALIKYVIAIGMLVGGLMVTQQIGGAAGSLAGKGMAALQKGQSLAVGAPLAALRGVGKFAGKRLADVRDIASEKMGVDLNLAAVWKRRNEQSEANRQLRLQRIRKGTLKTAVEGKTWAGRKMALASTGDVAWQNIVDKKHNILTAGSPEKMEKTLARINAGTEDKKRVATDINNIRGESGRTVTMSEYDDKLKRTKELKNINSGLTTQRDAITGSAAYEDLLKKESNRSITGSEQTDLGKQRTEVDRLNDNIKANEEDIKGLDHVAITIDKVEANRASIKNLEDNNTDLAKQKKDIIDSKDYQDLDRQEKEGSISAGDQKRLDFQRKRVKSLDDNIASNNKNKEKLSGSYIVVDDGAAKERAEKSRRAEIAGKEVKSKELDKEIEKFTRALQRNKLSEIETARAHIDSTMEAEANKKIATITNPDQLVGIFKEAVEAKDQGLIAAAYKKLTKTSNYNEIHRDLGIGTGYDGMIAMSHYLQDEGGLSQQDSRALIAEVGEIAKGVNHFEAFGAMSLNKAGQWGETGKENQQAAILGEKSKIQVQQLVRTANRLGMGEYRNGEPHDADHWDLAQDSIALFASKDEAYAKQMTETGNINLIQFIGTNPENLRKLEQNGAKKVAATIRNVMAKAGSSNVATPLDAIKSLTR
jgi:hypothetical protein